MDQSAELIKKIDALTNLLRPTSINEAMPKPLTHEQRVQNYQRMIQLSTLKK